MNKLLVEKDRLDHSDLQKLVDKEVLAIRIHPFIDTADQEAYLQNLADSNLFQRYSCAQDVGVHRIGMTLFETQNDPQMLEAYFRSGEQTYQILDRLFAPYTNPLKKLQQAFSESWANGGQLAYLNGKAMNPGILRKFDRGNFDGLPPHQDTIFKDQGSFEESKCIRAQLAANLYLQIPERGGELEIWNLSFSKEEEKQYYVGKYDFLDRSKIPPPSLRLKPKAGELILFRSDNVHSVRGSIDCERIAISCFFGYYGQNQPMRYWA